MDIESEAAKQFLSPKQKVYKIFDDIQTSLDTKENLSDFGETEDDTRISEQENPKFLSAKSKNNTYYYTINPPLL